MLLLKATACSVRNSSHTLNIHGELREGGREGGRKRKRERGREREGEREGERERVRESKQVSNKISPRILKVCRHVSVDFFRCPASAAYVILTFRWS